MAPTSTAVFRAVADFASLNREVKKTRAEIEKLQRQSGKTGDFDKFNSALEKTTTAQKNLRTETNSLAAAQSKLGKGTAATSQLEKSMARLADTQERARKSAGSLATEQDRLRDRASAAKGEVGSLATSMRGLADQEERATKSAQQHAKSLSDERNAARDKSSVIDKLTESIRKVAEADDKAAASAKDHADSLDRSRDAADQSVSSHRNLATAHGESGTAAKQSAVDHDALKAALDRLTPSAANARNSVSASSSSYRESGTAARSAASDQDGLIASLLRVGPAASSAASANRSNASSVRDSNSAMREGDSSANRLSSSLRGVGSSSRDSSNGARQLASVMSPLRATLNGTGVAGAGLRTILLGLGFAAVVPGVQLLVGALSSLVSGLVAIVGAAGPAVNAIAALGPMAVAAAGAVGTIASAFRGVGDALAAYKAVDQQAASGATSAAAQRVAAAKAIGAAQRGVRDAVQGQQDAEVAGARQVADAQRAVERAREDAAEGAVQAARRVEDANRDLIRANEDVLRAEEDLHDARRQAIRDLEDLSDRVHDSALTQEGAEISLLRAQERLAEVNADATASSLDRREAALRVAEAQDRINDVARQAARDQADLNEAQQGGVEGMPGVVSAQDSLKSAMEAQQSAARSLGDAQQAQAKQQRDSAQSVADAERNLAEAKTDSAKRQRDAAERVSDAMQRLAEAQDQATKSSGGASAAANKLAAALAKLSPEGRQMVEILRNLTPKFDELSRTAQTAMFPGLIKGLQLLIPMLDTVATPAVKAFGEVLGNLGFKLAEEVKSWEEDLKRFGTGGGPALIDKFGQAFINFASALEDVGVAAEPLAQWIGDLVLQLSEYYKKEAEIGRGDESLVKYFEKVRARLELLGKIIFNVGGIIKEVFKAGDPTGTGILEDFEKLTAETRKWMGTAEGKNAMAEYFKKVKPNLELTMGILGDIAKAFIDMGASETVTKMLLSIRDTMGPALERMFKAIGAAFDKLGPQIIELLSNLMDFFSNLSENGSGGGLSAFVSIIGKAVELLDFLTSIPIVSFLVSMMLAAKGATIAFAALGKVMAFLPGASKLNAALGGSAARAAAAANQPRTASTFGSGFTAGRKAADTKPVTGTARAGQAVGGLFRAGASAVGTPVVNRAGSAVPTSRFSPTVTQPSTVRALPPGTTRALPAGNPYKFTAGPGAGNVVPPTRASFVAGPGGVVSRVPSPVATPPGGRVPPITPGTTGARQTAAGASAARRAPLALPPGPSAGARPLATPAKPLPVRVVGSATPSASTPAKTNLNHPSRPAQTLPAPGAKPAPIRLKAGESVALTGRNAGQVTNQSGAQTRPAGNVPGSRGVGSTAAPAPAAPKPINTSNLSAATKAMAGYSAATQAAARATGAFGQTATGASSSLSRVGTSAAGSTKSVSGLSSAAQAAGKSASGLSQSAAGVASASSKIGAGANSASAGLRGVGSAASAAAAATSSAASTATSSGSKIGSAFSKVGAAVSGAFAPVAKTATTAFGGAATAASNAAGKVSSAFGSMTSKLTGVFKPVETSAASASSSLNNATTAANNTGRAMTGGVGAAATAAATNIRAVGTAAADSERRMTSYATAATGAGSAVRSSGTLAAGAAGGMTSYATAATNGARGAGALAGAAGTAGAAAGGFSKVLGGLSGALGGPFMVAMLGAIGLFALFRSATANSRNAIEQNNQAIANYRSAIDSSNGVIDESIRKSVAKSVSDQTMARSGRLVTDGLKDFKIGQEQVTTAITSGGQSLDTLRQRLLDVAEANSYMARSGYVSGGAQGGTYIETWNKEYNATGQGARELLAEIDKLREGFVREQYEALGVRAALNGVTIEQQKATEASRNHNDMLLASLNGDLAKKQSLDSVKESQKAYNDAVAANGAASAEAQAASNALQQDILNYITTAGTAEVAAAKLRGETDLDTAALRGQSTAALELAGTYKGPLPEALQKIITGMDGTAFAAAGAKVRIDETGHAVITLPGGKEIKLSDNAPETIARLREVESQLKKIQDLAEIRMRFDAGQATSEDYSRLKNDFAGGGIVPGYAPGKDTVPATLSPGEAVLVPELVKKIGAKNILRANREASGRSPNRNSSTGAGAYAGGGIVGRRRPVAQASASTGVGATNAPEAPAPIDAAAIAESAAALNTFTVAATAMATELTAKAFPALQQISTGGLAPLRTDLDLTSLTSQTVGTAISAAIEATHVAGNAALADLRATGLLPLRTDLTTTQTTTDAVTQAMTLAMQTHDLAANTSLLNIRTAGLLPLRTDLTTTQVHEQTTTTAMTNAMNLHRDLSNAATLAVRTAGLLPLRTDLTTTQTHTAASTTAMSVSTEDFKTRADTALTAVRAGLTATDTSVGNTAAWFKTQMATMQESASVPVRAVIEGPFNKGIIAAWNALDTQFTLNKHVPDVVPGFAKGGPLKGGEANKDSIPIMGMPGEYMLSKRAVNRLGGQGAVDAWHKAVRRGDTRSMQEMDQGGDPGGPGWAHMAEGGPVEAGLAFARSQVGKPYVWGATGPGSYDCSGFMSAIHGALTTGNPYVRRYTTSSFAGGATAGFVPGLSSAFSIGVLPGSHMAGTLGGINVESTPPAVIMGPGARGANDGMFSAQYSLPQVGGTFVSGGVGGVAFDPTPIVNAEFDKANKMISDFRAGNPSPHGQQLADIAQQGADKVKEAALAKVMAATAMAGPLAGAVSGSPDVIAAVKAVAARYGWGEGPQWDALAALVQGESSWNPNAANPTSSARGLFQKLTGTHGPVEPTAAGQAEWGLNYIKGKYGDPITAYRMWSSRSPHWYAKGGYVPGRGNGDTEPAMLTPGEYVLSRPAAESLGPQNLAALNAMRPGAFSDNAAQYMALGGVVQRNNGLAYQIKRGDSLSGIARAYGTTVDELKRLNKIANVNKVLTGQWLNMPRTPTPAAAAKSTTGDMGRYQIQRGDTLWSLARRFETTVSELARINNIKDPGKIFTGAWLSYPKKGATPDTTTPAPTPDPTAPATGDGTTTPMTLDSWSKGIAESTAQTKEFESNLLKLSGWGYDDLAIALAKMGLGTGTTDGGGLALSREAVKSPGNAAKVEKILEESKNVIGANLENALTVIGALRKTAGLGVREVSTATKIDTKDIFTMMENAQVAAQIAQLPSPNKDKFLSNMDAYKRGLPFARGGRVPGTGVGDTVPAMLTPGEFVLRKDAVRKIGVQALHELNDNPMQHFANGGPVLDAADLFSFVGSPSLSRPRIGRAVQEKLAKAISSASSGDTNSKSVVFSEGAVQITNPAPQRSTDSFEGTMQKLNFAGVFS
ncbi:MAG: LysM peptidoglycan-binding domain-containing protein [Candidatus Nanopelagicales bacterium]